MALVQAVFRVEVDWSDLENNPFGHESADVTYLLNSWKSTHGNTVYLEDREGRLDVGEGQMQLRYEDSVFGASGTINQDQLNGIHKIRLTDTTTETECWTGLVEHEVEFNANFTNGDVLTFNLHGNGFLKDGGFWTYPRGSAFGGTIDDGQSVVVSEDPIDPTEFALEGTVSAAIPTTMLPTTDGKLVGQDSTGIVIELDGTTRRAYEAIATDGVVNRNGRNTNYETNVTRTYRNYEQSRLGPGDFSSGGTINGTLPSQMQIMGDGRAIGILSNDAVVELDGTTRRQYGAIGVDVPSTTVTGVPGRTRTTVNKRTRNYESRSRLYLLDNTNNEIKAYTPDANRVTPEDTPININVNNHLAGIAATEDYIFVAENGDNTQNRDDTRVRTYNKTGTLTQTSSWLSAGTATGLYATDSFVYLMDNQVNNIVAYAVNSSGLVGAADTDEDIPLPVSQWTGVSGNNDRIVAVANSNRVDTTVAFQIKLDAKPILLPANASVPGVGSTATRIFVAETNSRSVLVYSQDGTAQTSEGFNLNSLNGNPSGMAVTATRIFVTDSSDFKVYVYDHDGTRQDSEEFDLDIGLGSPHGIAVSDDRIYVGYTRAQDTEFIASFTHSGVQQTSERLEIEIQRIADLDYDNGIVYAVDDLGNKVVAVNTDGTSNVGESISLPPGLWTGIGVTNGNVYLADSNPLRKVLFQMPSGTRPIRLFRSSSSGQSFTGIALVGDRLFVSEAYNRNFGTGKDSKVQEYRLSGGRENADFISGTDVSNREITGLGGIELDPSILSTTNADEANYSVPATIRNETESITYNGPIFDFSRSLYRARRRQGREFSTYSAGSDPPAENTSSSEWTDSKTFNRDIHYVDITYSWSSGQTEQQTWDVWELGRYSYSRGSDMMLDIRSAASRTGTIPAVMQSGSRTYFTAGSSLYLISGGTLYQITDIGNETIEATSLGSLPAAVDAARAGAEIGRYRYLISDNGSRLYNIDDLDNTPTRIGTSFAGALRPHAIAYTDDDVYLYNLTNNSYWTSSRALTLLGSQSSTVSYFIPAHVGRERDTITYFGPMFHVQSKLWRARRTVTRTYNTWDAGNTIEFQNGDWFQTQTFDPSIHSVTTQYSWSSGNATDSNVTTWDYAGWSARRGNDGALDIGSSPSTGGEVPALFQSQAPLYFPAAGGLYAIYSGTLYQVTGFPGAPDLVEIDDLADDISRPRGVLYVGRRAYLIDNDGTNVYQLDALTGTAATDLGAFPSSLVLNYLAYSSEKIFAYQVSGTRNVYEVDRFTRTAKDTESDADEDQVRALTDSLDQEYFDENRYGDHPFEYLQSLADDLGVEFNEARCSNIDENVSGLVRYGPRWDIALADAAYTGWTGQFLFALKDGSIAAAFPGDLPAGNRAMTFENYFVVGPLEIKRNREMITNASYVTGIERLRTITVEAGDFDTPMTT